MKRKKFVKQLMSLGLDRNGAEDTALVARVHRRESYEQALDNFLDLLHKIEAEYQEAYMEFIITDPIPEVVKV